MLILLETRSRCRPERLWRWWRRMACSSSRSARCSFTRSPSARWSRFGLPLPWAPL